MRTRQISLETIREAAGTVYDAAVRTPLVRLPTGRRRPRGVPQARNAAADRIVQDPRRLQRRRASWRRRQLADGVWTVSAGNAAQGVALAARQRGRAAAACMVMDTAPETKLRAIERLGATIVKALVRRVLAHGRGAPLRPDARALRPPVRRRRLHQRQRHDRRSRSSKICRTSTRSSRRSAAAGCSPASRVGAARRCGPDATVYAAEPETAAPLSASLAAGRASRFDDWQAVVRRRRRRQVGARRRCGRCCATASTDSIVVSLDDAARGDAAGRRARARDRRRRGGLRGCRRVSPAMAARGHRKVVAVVSGGNIDLARFAQLVGACDAATSGRIRARMGDTVTPNQAAIPERLQRLPELAIDLWWTWNTPRARACSGGSTTRCGGRPRTTRC